MYIRYHIAIIPETISIENVANSIDGNSGRPALFSRAVNIAMNRICNKVAIMINVLFFMLLCF